MLIFTLTLGLNFHLKKPSTVKISKIQPSTVKIWKKVTVNRQSQHPIETLLYLYGWIHGTICNDDSKGCNIVPTFEPCGALKIVVANRLV